MTESRRVCFTGHALSAFQAMQAVPGQNTASQVTSATATAERSHPDSDVWIFDVRVVVEGE